MVGFELEVLAKKFDRFGWERDRGSAAHDRLVIDWMDALQDYPLEEVRAACRAAVVANPDRMPNEGHVLRQIIAARRHAVTVNRPTPAPVQLPAPRVNLEERREQAARIMREAGWAVQNGARNAGKGADAA